MGLFTPAWKKEYVLRANNMSNFLGDMIFSLGSIINNMGDNKAVKEVNAMTCQSELAQVALESPRYIARYTAIERLTNQSLLHDIALRLDFKMKTNQLRLQAARKLTDQSLANPIIREIEVNTRDAHKQRRAREIAELSRLTRKHSESFIKDVHLTPSGSISCPKCGTGVNHNSSVSLQLRENGYYCNQCGTHGKIIKS
ncbi:MAG: hypothetical protein FWB80_06345 [Defluviitaleaceae bacterium]|nr:hypothetical protein [Defluviitaleaceae bacterium]